MTNRMHKQLSGRVRALKDSLFDARRTGDRDDQNDLSEALHRAEAELEEFEYGTLENIDCCNTFQKQRV
mgnify:CR=1 FL=1